MTNTFEGEVFVNANFTDNITLADYVTQLVPQFNESQIQATVARYTNIGLDTVLDQAIGVMGECKLQIALCLRHARIYRKAIFICPTYSLLENFNGPSFKVTLP